MKPPSQNPISRKDRSIDLLIQGIAEGKTFDRVNAYAAVMKEKKDG